MGIAYNDSATNTEIKARTEMWNAITKLSPLSERGGRLVQSDSRCYYYRAVSSGESGEEMKLAPYIIKLSNFVEDYNCTRCGMPLTDETAFIFGVGENGHLHLVCKNLKPCIM